MNSALERRGKIRDLTALASCKQGTLGSSWRTGNSLEPLEALASAVGNLRAQQGDSSPRSQSICWSEQEAHRESRLKIGPH